MHHHVSFNLLLKFTLSCSCLVSSCDWNARWHNIVVLLSGTNQEKKKKVSDYDIFVTHSVAAFKQDVGTPPKKVLFVLYIHFWLELSYSNFFFLLNQMCIESFTSESQASGLKPELLSLKLRLLSSKGTCRWREAVWLFCSSLTHISSPQLECSESQGLVAYLSPICTTHLGFFVSSRDNLL